MSYDESDLKQEIIKMYNEACDECSTGLKTDGSQRKVVYYKPGKEYFDIGEALCFSCQKKLGVNWKQEYKEQCKRLGVPEKILRSRRRVRFTNLKF